MWTDVVGGLFTITMPMRKLKNISMVNTDSRIPENLYENISFRAYYTCTYIAIYSYVINF